uniref:Metastriate one of each protein family n=1 Tax=Rhipicephalus zambeziensis TaxID=60191 RepID=A0A224YA35_9ACAR
MSFGRSLAALLLVASYGATIAHNAGCDFSGIDLEGAVDKVLDHLHHYRYPDQRGFQFAYSGLETGDVNVIGFDQIRRFGPIHPYCVNGSRLISVDFVAPDDVILSLPWKACSGQEGTVNLRAGFSRFTVVFGVQAGGLNQDATLTFEGFSPVITSEPRVYIDGAGPELRQATIILSKMLPSLSQYYWNIYFFTLIKGAIYQAIGYRSEW